MVGGQWLDRKNVQRGSGNFAGFQRGDQIRFRNDSPRAQFTIFTPGFILANAAALSISLVSFVTGM